MKTNYKNILAFIAYACLYLMICSCQTPLTAEDPKNKSTDDLILSLNAYSFSDLMMARDSRDKQQLYSLFNLLDWCSTQKIQALDPTGYFFPTYPVPPSDEYLKAFKDRAAQLGIAISGTGIRNNFASPDPEVRAAGVQLAKEWIEVASKIGAPVLRVFAGAIPEGYEDNWEIPAQWMIDCYKELIPEAQKYGVKIGVQNHGEMLQTAEQCIYVLEAVNSDWVGLIVDTGNFKTVDPYEDIRKVIPYAINWQVKESVFGIGSEVRTDFKKLIGIIKEGGYTGYLPVETLLVRGVPYDPFKLVPEMMIELQNEIDQEYNQ